MRSAIVEDSNDILLLGKKLKQRLTMRGQEKRKGTESATRGKRRWRRRQRRKGKRDQKRNTRKVSAARVRNKRLNLMRIFIQ